MSLTSQEPIERIPNDINTTTLPPVTSPTTKSPLAEFSSNVVEVAAAARAKLTAVVTASSALQILNKDYAQICKPNAIVRPVRRVEEPIGGLKPIPIHDLSQSLPDIGKGITQKKNAEEFDKELGSKLRKLQQEAASKTCSKHASAPDSLNNRPIFITTVPKGVFLEPVKELPVIRQRRIYSFASRPKVLITNKYNYSDHEEMQRFSMKTLPPIDGIRRNHSEKIRDNTQQNEPFRNIMHDRRVVRGSNYSQHLGNEWNPYFAYAGLLSGKGQADTFASEVDAKRRLLLRKRMIKNPRGIIGTPPPVLGRKHEIVQTDKYLEELFDKPVEMDTSVQTDLFLQRPPSPPYIPAKTGVDVATEILDGELFDFDSEVQPILETLVGHSVEQGLVEVIHEEEIAEMKKQQQEFLALRELDLAELRRLEAEEIRLQAERDRRTRQDEISQSLDAEMKERITAAKLLRGHIADLIPGVLKDLEPLQDAENREELERKLCPWLAEEVAQEVGLMIDSREMLTEIVKEILKERSETYSAMNSSKNIEVGEDDETLGEGEEESELVES